MESERINMTKGKVSKEKELSKEESDLKELEKNKKLLFNILLFIFLSLIYLISIFHKSITFVIFGLLNIFEYCPYLFDFIIELILVYGIVSKFNSSFYTFIFAVIVASIIIYILKRLKILLFDYYI